MAFLKSSRGQRFSLASPAKAADAGVFDVELASLYSQQIRVSSLSQGAHPLKDGPAASAASRQRTYQIDRLRLALLTTIAASALFVYGGRPARADCANDGTTLACMGTITGTLPPSIVNGGIDVPAGITILDVNNLTQAINPATDVNGITFIAGQTNPSPLGSDVAVNSDTGTQGIAASGGANGIMAGSFGTVHNAIVESTASGNVTVNSTGNITSQAYGINAYSTDRIVAEDSIATVDSAIAGSVGVNSWGNISAEGGILARSGLLIAPISVTPNSSAIAIVDSAKSGNVNINNAGDITATGDFRNGISATSTVSFSPEIYYSGTVDGHAASAVSGNVVITSKGNILIAGSSSIGIAAYSAVFGYDYATSAAAGDVTVNSTGNITGSASDSIGIFAQSKTYGGAVTTNGNITVNILGGTVTGGTGSGVGIQFNDGADNSLTNHGIIQALSGMAVVGGTGNESIDNYGLIIGNVDLGSGANAFDNRLDGTFRSGASVNLGTGNTLTNAGTLSPFGKGAIGTTTVTGNLVQTTPGTFAVDIDLVGHTADRLNASGTASLAGTVAVDITSLPNTLSQQFTILSSSETTHTDLALLASPALHATLSYPDAQDVVLGISVDFANPGLTPNEKAVGDYLDAAFAGGSGGLSPVLLALLNTPGVDDYKAALDRLSPEHYLAQVEDTVQANLLFIDSMMSCPSANGRPNYIYEGQCYWAKVSGRSYDWDRTQSNIGGDTEGWTVSGGVQVALTETMRLGFAGSYEHTNISTSNAASSEGDRGEGGVVLKDRWGNTSFAVAAFGGYGSFETKRYIGLDGIGTAEGNQGISFGGAHARISHLLDQGGWYLKPMVDFDAIYVDYGDLNEHGGGAANLAVHGNNEWVLSARPAIEIGSEFKASDGSFVRPYVRLGGLFFDDNSFALTSDFVAAPSGISPFTITSSFDQSYFSVGAGMDVLTLSGINVKLNYEGLFVGHSDANSGGLKAGVKF